MDHKGKPELRNGWLNVEFVINLIPLYVTLSHVADGKISSLHH